MSHDHPKSGAPVRHNGARIEVRLENVREFEQIYASVKQSIPEGKIELKYPSFWGITGVHACACCGEKAQTAVFVTYTQLEHHASRYTVHRVPACELCKRHQKIGKSSLSCGCLLGIVFGFVMIGLMVQMVLEGSGHALLYLIPILIIVEILLSLPGKKADDEHEKEVKAAMGEKCPGAVFAGFKREYRGILRKTPIDIFWFSNREYAVRFCEMNGGTMDSPSAPIS